jgi:hypothetical protein
MADARTLFWLVPAALLAAAAGGCARYEYDLVRPQELAQHVGTKQWVVLRRDELEYRLRTSDNRLVALVYNRGGRAVKLSGADSAAVDPRGESHPLQGRTLPPDSYVKLILPPPRPEVRSYGPTFGFGVGVGYSRRFGRPYRDGLGYGSVLYDDVEPRYYTVYDPNDRSYYDWPGESDLRLLLAFERDGAEGFRHEFVFRRRKM